MTNHTLLQNLPLELFYQQIHSMYANDEFPCSKEFWDWLQADVDESKVRPELLKYCERMDEKNQVLADAQLSKTRFCEIIRDIQRCNELIDKSAELLREYGDIVITDFCSTFPFLHHETLVVELLEKIMRDKGEWISYFIYELKFGQRYKDGCVTDGVGADGGSNIDISTPEKLYDFLVKEGAERYE